MNYHLTCIVLAVEVNEYYLWKLTLLSIFKKSYFSVWQNYKYEMEKTRNDSTRYLITPERMFRTERYFMASTTDLSYCMQGQSRVKCQETSNSKWNEVERENPISLKNPEYRQFLRTYTWHSTSAWQWVHKLMTGN